MVSDRSVPRRGAQDLVPGQFQPGVEEVGGDKVEGAGREGLGQVVSLPLDVVADTFGRRVSGGSVQRDL